MQTRNRLRYLVGMVAGIFVAAAIGIALVLFVPLQNFVTPARVGVAIGPDATPSAAE